MVYLPIAQSVITALSLTVTLLALLFNRKSWLEGNRPFVTARIAGDHDSPSGPIPIAFVLENVGNRPALNVRLRFDQAQVMAATIIDAVGADRLAFERITDPASAVAVLPNGRSAWGYAGHITVIWKPNAKLDITVSYEGLNGFKYHHVYPLVIVNDASFTGITSVSDDKGYRKVFPPPPPR